MFPENGGEGAGECDVAVVGGGPSGLALAAALKDLGVGRVVVLERDREPGGAPRHCGHYPFGVQEFRRLLKGPDYARRHAAAAVAAGVDLRTGVTVTGLRAGGRLGLSSGEGLGEIAARRVALCTGTREASRAQRFIGGARPPGVVTTGALQSLVYLEGLRPFHNPVVVGSELVAFSALLTCRHAGIRPAAMIEQRDRIVVRAFARALPFALGVPLILGARVRRILGNARVEGVEISGSGETVRNVAADGVICTGEFRPEAELLCSGGLELDLHTGGPVVDQFGRASDPAYYCAGNLLRPVETSTWCAREGRDTAARIAADLAGDPAAPIPATPVRAAHDAIRYVLPQRLAHSDLAPGGAMEYLQIRLARPARGRLCARADGREVWSIPINSRPERRLLAPLAALLPHRGASAIEIVLRES